MNDATDRKPIKTVIAITHDWNMPDRNGDDDPSVTHSDEHGYTVHCAGDCIVNITTTDLRDLHTLIGAALADMSS